MKKAGGIIIGILGIITISIISGYYKQKKEINNRKEEIVRTPLHILVDEDNNELKESKLKFRKLYIEKNNCELIKEEENILVSKLITFIDNINKTVIQLQSFKIDDQIGLLIKFSSLNKIEKKEIVDINLIAEDEKTINFNLDEVGEVVKHDSGLFINSIFVIWENPDLSKLLDVEFRQLNIKLKNGNINLNLDDSNKELSKIIRCVYY